MTIGSRKKNNENPINHFFSLAKKTNRIRFSIVVSPCSATQKLFKVFHQHGTFFPRIYHFISFFIVVKMGMPSRMACGSK
jgi:hypothetical protein